MDPSSLKNHEGILNQFANFKSGTLQISHLLFLAWNVPKHGDLPKKYITANLENRHCNCTNKVQENADMKLSEFMGLTMFDLQFAIEAIIISKYLWRSDPEIYMLIEWVGGASPFWWG